MLTRKVVSILLLVLLLISMSLVATPVAQANGNTISGRLWHVPEAVADLAIPANVPVTVPDVTFDVNSPLNFSATNATVGNWLASGGAFNIVENTPGTLASLMDNNVTGTLVEFTGVVTVTNGQTFTVTHDDGLTLIIGGINLGFNPGPTPPVTTTATYTGPSGNFQFQLVYCEGHMGPAVLQVDLPFVNPGTLKIFKFNDFNGNGSQDAGELPLQNWSFLTTGPGGYTNTSNTDSSGFITLSNIAPGNYTTTETVILGWRLTTPPNPKTATVTSGQLTGLSFGNQQLGTLKIFKFEDKNWNQLKDANEPVLSGWGFNISGPGGYSFSGVTDSSGLISLTNLVPGVYNVTEIPKPGGWIPTNGAGIRSAMVPPGGVATFEFGNEILPQTPASSDLGIGLMIGGFTGVMALFILRRRKSHQEI